MDDDEYAKLEEQRKDNDFIVGDEDGYKDYGGEIWENQDEFENENKKNTKLKNFFSAKRKDLTSTTKRQPQAKPVISNEKSSKVMNSLLKKLDNDDDDCSFQGHDEELEGQMQSKFNIYDQGEDIFDQCIPKTTEEIEAEKRQQQQYEEEKITFEEKPLDMPQSRFDSKSKHSKIFDDHEATKENNGNLMNSSNEDRNGSNDVEMEDVSYDYSKMKQHTSQHADMNFPLPTNTDGSVDLFYYDAHEEFNNQSEVYLFGKVYNPSKNKYFSTCITVRGIERILYVVPNEGVELSEVIDEIKNIFQTRFPDIKKWKMRPATKSYCFEMPVQKGQSQFLEIRYGCGSRTLPQNLTGKTFKHIFGKTTSVLETLLIQSKMKGPCWINIKNFKQNTTFKKSWCNYDLVVDSPKCIKVCEDGRSRDPPQLKVISIAMKSFKNQKKTKEIVAISLTLHEEVECEKQTPKYEKGYKRLTLIRKLNDIPWPYGFEDEIKNKKKKVYKYETEKALIEEFVSKLHKNDPDLIVAHGMGQGLFDTLMDRIDKNRVNMWSRIARFKRSNIPRPAKKEAFSFGNFWLVRQSTIGRLVWDTFLSAKELLKETNYDLCHLVNSQFKVKHLEFDPAMIPSIFTGKSENILNFIDHTERDSHFTMGLLFKLNIIPLTKQLTNIAGNLWYRSLQNARAERNEWFLLHEFTSRNFICPDKDFSKKAPMNTEEDKREDDDKPGRRKKAAYEGGLVLDPKPGLYDKIVMLLDFNSLYPSIIQEYDLWFTTVDRTTTHDFQGNEIWDAEIEKVDIPIPSAETKKAILPHLLRTLVEKRRQVKKDLKNEKDQGRREQLDIKQQALKVTANSMYGCLGFSSSRFFAKAIAALITRKGRDALKATVDVATMLGYNVIYGDTDSIMIATGSDDLKESLRIGEKIKSDVNKRYKCLEIETDGVFRSLLLLKKKKYAALVYEDLNDPNSYNKKEIKGLDMVRRDWWSLSKEIGKKVLNEILSAKNQDDIQINLRALFEGYSDKIKNKNIPIKEYIITKQLTRPTSEYKQSNSLPHVVVANRKKEKEGKSDTELVGAFIKYVIWEGDKSKSSAEKAYDPRDLLAAKGKLNIDIDWYLSQQIYPPIERLIEHIEGIDGKFICDCFGLDHKKHSNFTKIEPNSVEEENYQQKFLDVAKNKDNLERCKGKFTLQLNINIQLWLNTN